MKFSIIVPVLNEKRNIERLTKQLQVLEGEFEVILADGGSNSDELPAANQCYTVLACERGRAVQMNAAASLAQGEVLLFLHCDSIIGTKALLSAEELLTRGYDAGCFTMEFDDTGFWLNMISYLSNMRVKLFKIIFGDQGIFIKKEAFEKLGGFPEIPIMEDLQFSLRARRHIRMGQCKCRIITSARRFRKNGVLKTIILMHWLKLLYFMGADTKRLNEIYKNVR